MERQVEDVTCPIEPAEEVHVLNVSSRIRHNLPRPLCPFISSTFQGFQAEREYLVKKTFPALETISKERGSYFSPIDLRWGISDEQAQSGQVIRLCLDYIDQSSPFFICLLGERYGQHRNPYASPLPYSSAELPPESDWLDRSFLMAAENGHTWVLEEYCQQCSVTELEVIKAAFRDKQPHCYFYIRDPDHVFDLITAGSTREDVDMVLKEYISESAYAASQMANLKYELLEMEQYSVHFFRTPEELGQKVLQDWTAVINHVCPEAATNRGGLDTAQYQELILQETFADRRRQVFIPNPGVLKVQKALDEFVQPLVHPHNGQTETICILSGESGSGKTSLLVDWMDHIEVADTIIPVFCLYVGSSPGSTDVAAFLQRCVIEMADICVQKGMPFPDGLLEKEDKDESFHEVYSGFEEAVKHCPCILIIDGIDRVGQALECSAEQVQELAWLPTEALNSCRFIFSTSPDSAIMGNLKRKQHVLFLKVPALDAIEENKTSIVEENLKWHCKTLSSKQLASIAASPLSHRPVFQTILASELRVFGNYEQLDQHLQSYVSVGSISELWQRIIHRWCLEYGWTQHKQKPAGACGWVMDSLQLLAASHYGLTSAEILDILPSLGYQGAAHVTSMDWALFQSVAGEALCQQLGGTLTFACQDVRETVEEMLPGNASEYQRHIADYLLTQPGSVCRTEELLWQLERCCMFQDLSDALANPRIFMEIYDLKRDHSKRLRLLHYWHCLCQTGEHPGKVYITMLQRAGDTVLPDKSTLKDVFKYCNISKGNQEKAEVDEGCFSLKGGIELKGPQEFAALALAVGQFLAELSYFSDAEMALGCANAVFQPAGSDEEHHLHCEVQQALADLHYFQLQTSTALSWYSQARVTVDYLLGHTESQSSKWKKLILLKGEILDRMANIYTFDYKYAEAGPLLDEARVCMEVAASTPGCARVAHHQGILLFRQGHYDDAYKTLTESEHSRVKWFGQFHPKVAEVQLEIADQLADRRNPRFNFHTSMKMYKVVLETRCKHLGAEHLLVATTLFHMARLMLRERRDRTEAMEMLKKAHQIRVDKLGADHRITQAVFAAIEQEKCPFKGHISDNRPVTRDASVSQRSVELHPSETSTWWRGPDNNSSGQQMINSFSSLNRRYKRLADQWSRTNGVYGQHFGYMQYIDDYYHHGDDYPSTERNVNKKSSKAAFASPENVEDETSPPDINAGMLNSSASSQESSLNLNEELNPICDSSKLQNPHDVPTDNKSVFSWSHLEANLWELSQKVLDSL